MTTFRFRLRLSARVSSALPWQPFLQAPHLEPNPSFEEALFLSCCIPKGIGNIPSALGFFLFQVPTFLSSKEKTNLQLSQHWTLSLRPFSWDPPGGEGMGFLFLFYLELWSDQAGLVFDMLNWIKGVRKSFSTGEPGFQDPALAAGHELWCSKPIMASLS